MALTTHLQPIQAYVKSSWAKVPEVEQVLLFETEGISEVHTVITTTDREVCYRVYVLEQKLMAQFPGMLFDFNLALHRYDDHSLSTSKAVILYDPNGRR